MIHCGVCNSNFSSKASLCSHRSKYHKDMSKNNTIAVVNRNYKHNDKKVMSLGSTSGESSDSDESIHPEFDPELDEGLEVAD